MNNKRNVKFISIVIPVYNEKASLDELINRCLSACRYTDKELELILVDDGSSDGSVEIITAASKKHPRKVISCILNKNYGQHNAILAGFSIVKGDLIVTIDADLQNPPEEIPKLVAQIEKGYDVVGSVRKNRKDSLFRKLVSMVFNLIVRISTGVKMIDYGCMLRAYDRKITDAILLSNDHSIFIPIHGNKYANNVCEIPVIHNERSTGKSKYKFRNLIKLQINVLISIATHPLRLLTYIGLFLIFSGLAFISYQFFVAKEVENILRTGNNLTLFIIFYIIVGILFIGFGVIGESISYKRNKTQIKTKYVIKKIINGE